MSYAVHTTILLFVIIIFKQVIFFIVVYPDLLKKILTLSFNYTVNLSKNDFYF